VTLLAASSTLGVAEIALALVGCVCDRLTDTPAGAPCFCGVVPGGPLVSMDYCGCSDGGCGMAYVRLDTVFPSRVFPAPDFTAANCATGLAARFFVGCFRCVPGISETGQPPSEVDQMTAADMIWADMAALYTAIRCCVDDVLGLSWGDVVVGGYVPVGPSGDCAGGQWPVTVRVT